MKEGQKKKSFRTFIRAQCPGGGTDPNMVTNKKRNKIVYICLVSYLEQETRTKKKRKKEDTKGATATLSRLTRANRQASKQVSK